MLALGLQQQQCLECIIGKSVYAPNLNSCSTGADDEIIVFYLRNISLICGYFCTFVTLVLLSSR